MMYYIGNTTVQRVKFERNRLNTTSEEWNLKSKFHVAKLNKSEDMYHDLVHTYII